MCIRDRYLRVQRTCRVVRGDACPRGCLGGQPPVPAPYPPPGRRQLRGQDGVTKGGPLLRATKRVVEQDPELVAHPVLVVRTQSRTRSRNSTTSAPSAIDAGLTRSTPAVRAPLFPATRSHATVRKSGW